LAKIASIRLNALYATASGVIPLGDDAAPSQLKDMLGIDLGNYRLYASQSGNVGPTTVSVM
jgi:hypothetical protein